MLYFFVHFPTFFLKYGFLLHFMPDIAFLHSLPLESQPKIQYNLNKYAIISKGEIIMDLVTVRQIYKDREQYLNKEISVGGWVRSLRDS